MERNKNISKMISNLANAVVHQILEKAIDKDEVKEYYKKEIKNSWELSKNIRNEINPIDRIFNINEVNEILRKLKNKINSELNLRINKGYEDIDLSLVDIYVINSLKELKII